MLCKLDNSKTYKNLEGKAIEMKRFNVTGMSCAACQARVEKAVNAVEGVESCAVNLLMNSMLVEGDASSETIIKAVEAAGYGASANITGTKNASTTNEQMSSNINSIADDEIRKMKVRLIASAILLLPLMYVTMGHMLWNWPLPAFLDGNPISTGIYELLLAGLVMVINQKFFINGFKGLVHLSPNMDTLVALGSSASFAYSVFALFSLSDFVVNSAGNMASHTSQFYFESAAMILTLITVGKMLEVKSKGKTTDALKALMELAPRTAIVLRDDTEVEILATAVQIGDKVVVRPGDSIPVDGIVVSGESAVNEAALTGESVPVDKQAGDKVYAATINTSGYMIFKATGVGEDTTLAEIIRMVSDAAATKAPIAKIADKVSGIFVPVVIAISFVTFIAWLLLGQTAGYAIARAVSVLVISCPCALGLATPVAIMVGNGVGARNGILFKNAASLERAGKTQIVALDKTGTITTGIMKVTDVIPAENVKEEFLLQIACALEKMSEHPISKAIVDYTENQGTGIAKTHSELQISNMSDTANGNTNNTVQIEDFIIVAGNGLRGRMKETIVLGGSRQYIESEGGRLNSEQTALIEKLSKEGKTPVLFMKDQNVLGIIGVADTLKADSGEAIAWLKQMGMRVVMLTGDNEITAQAIAEQAGIDEVVASVKPDGKESIIRQLQSQGSVAMVGDGINDAPALTRADIGIAIGAGTDIAIDAADIVLMKNSLMDVAAAIKVSRATIRNIHQNLFWAFFYNIIGIPIAAGCYAGWGLTLNPMFGAAAMGLSSFCVVSNALRLNMLKVYDDNKNKINIIKESEEKEMKINVNGMMCGHCEAHVKKALEALEGIESAMPSHEENTVVITTSKDVEEALIKAAIEDAGYEYAGMK